MRIVGEGERTLGTKVGRRLVHELATPGANGRIYEVSNAAEDWLHAGTNPGVSTITN